MLQGYEDILDAVKDGLGNRIAPTWYDENGVPRFAKHHPKLCPDIYATDVLLLKISCQACEEEFHVQMSWSASGILMRRAVVLAETERLTGVKIRIPDPATVEPHLTLAGRVTFGTLHYGDPPRHDYTGAMCSGVTMNCNDLRVLEFWRRESDWQRIHPLEIELPDAAEHSLLAAIERGEP